MKQRWLHISRGLWFAITLVNAALPTSALACAVCAGTEDYGYFWGVLALMIMPFMVGSIIGGWLWYSYRQGNSEFHSSGVLSGLKRRLSSRVFTFSTLRRPDAADRLHHA